MFSCFSLWTCLLVYFVAYSVALCSLQAVELATGGCLKLAEIMRAAIREEVQGVDE